MATKELLWADDWSVGMRVWLERAGVPVLGKGRVELLEAIDRHQSISAAARQLGMSYRHAWMLVQAMNDAAGKPLVVTATGGHHGGGATLTSHGQKAAASFRTLQTQLLQKADLLPRRVEVPEVATIHVSAASSLEEVLSQLLAEYTPVPTAVRVRPVFGASDELADHLLAGAPGDLFLTADPHQLDRLKQERLVKAGTRVVLCDNTLAAISTANRVVTVRKPADLARAGVARVALAALSCPLGAYTRAFLESRGLTEAIHARALIVDNARAVIAAVRGDQADIGLVYGSDAACAAGCRRLFQVRRLPIPVRYEGAVICRGQEADRARELLDFLKSPAALRRLRSCGFICVR
jgi:molybdenum ABC transporter molybdate-binding protein